MAWRSQIRRRGGGNAGGNVACPNFPVHPTSANVVSHVLNRANARRTLFEDDGDYAAYERVLEQARKKDSLQRCRVKLSMET